MKAENLEGVDPTADWFVNAFESGRSWESSLAVGLVSSRGREPAEIVSTMAGLRSAGVANLDFVGAIEDWDHVRVDDPPEGFDAIAELLDLTSTKIERYLHFRRLTGHGETFSDTVRAPLTLVERERRELDALQQLVTEAEPERAAAMRKRIEALEDADRRQLRLSAAAKRSRNAFDRGLESLEADALQATLDRAVRQALERLRGRSIDGSFPRGLRAAMSLLTASDIDPALLRSFVEDILSGRPLWDRPPNRDWLEAISAKGVDTERWLAGVDVTVDAGGEVLRFETERDPLHVLEMGTYFKTCLSLDDGFNQASTLANALDVNKQVLYGRREDGTVVARKLIAVTDEGEMLGYRTYAFENSHSVSARLDAALAQFATECGLRLGSTGAPSSLHGGFWYDDGVEPWPKGTTDWAIPDEVPDDDDAVREWALEHGFDDPESWWWLTWRDYGDLGLAAAAQLWIREPESARERGWQRVVAAELACRGVTTYGPHLGWAGTAEAYGLPFHAEAAGALLETIRQSSATNTFGEHDQIEPVPAAFATRPVADGVSFLIEQLRLMQSSELQCLRERHVDCIASARIATANVLHTAWFLHGADPDALDRLLGSREEILVDVGIDLAMRISEPSAGRRLRGLLKERGPDGRLEWAVARQQDDASRWVLENIAARETGNRSLAAALYRLYDFDTGAEALDEFDDECIEARPVRDLPPAHLPHRWLEFPDQPSDAEKQLHRVATTGHPDANPAGLEIPLDEGSLRRHQETWELARRVATARGPDLSRALLDTMGEDDSSPRFPASQRELLELRIRAFEHHDDAAVEYLIRTGAADLEIPLAAHVASEGAIGRVWDALARGLYEPVAGTTRMLAQYRRLFERMPEGGRAHRNLHVSYREDYLALLGDDPANWRRWIAGFGEFDGRGAQVVAMYSTVASPTELDRFLEELDLPTDATAAEQILAAVALDDQWRARSFRVAEFFVDRLAGYLSEEATERVLRLRDDERTPWWRALFESH